MGDTEGRSERHGQEQQQSVSQDSQVYAISIQLVAVINFHRVLTAAPLGLREGEAGYSVPRDNSLVLYIACKITLDRELQFQSKLACTAATRWLIMFFQVCDSLFAPLMLPDNLFWG